MLSTAHRLCTSHVGSRITHRDSAGSVRIAHISRIDGHSKEKTRERPLPMDFPVTGMLRERGGTAAMRLSVLHFAMSLNQYHLAEPRRCPLKTPSSDKVSKALVLRRTALTPRPHRNWCTVSISPFVPTSAQTPFNAFLLSPVILVQVFIYIQALAHLSPSALWFLPSRTHLWDTCNATPKYLGNVFGECRSFRVHGLVEDLLTCLFLPLCPPVSIYRVGPTLILRKNALEGRNLKPRRATTTKVGCDDSEDLSLVRY
jgi:hypothetical protein